MTYSKRIVAKKKLQVNKKTKKSKKIGQRVVTKLKKP